jgi:hypothetical protein
MRILIRYSDSTVQAAILLATIGRRVRDEGMRELARRSPVKQIRAYTH